MEVSIHTARTGLDESIIGAIKRLAPRYLIPHNVERQLALRIRTDSWSLLSKGDLVVHKEAMDAREDQVSEVVRATDDGRVDLEDVSGERFESISFPADLIVFDLGPLSGADAEPGMVEAA